MTAASGKAEGGNNGVCDEPPLIRAMRAHETGYGTLSEKDAAEIMQYVDFLLSQIPRRASPDEPHPESPHLATAAANGPGEAVAWRTGVPDIPKGTERQFIIACRRKDGKTYVFAAQYLNEKVLNVDDDQFFDNDDEEEGRRPFSGWFTEEYHPDYDTRYTLVCDPGEEVTHYRPLPAPPGASASTPQPGMVTVPSQAVEDAKRYRWLRDSQLPMLDGMGDICVVQYPVAHSDGSNVDLFGKELDSAIDSAMEEK